MSSGLIKIEGPLIDLRFVDETVARIGRTSDAVIPILQAIQEHFHYLPEEALRRVTEITDITPATITGVSTFYAQFRHKPAGKHILRVCHGTACHVKGSELVEDAVRRQLQIEKGHDTDPNGDFTVEHVGCLGCCTLAPVVQIDAITYGHQTPENVRESIDDFLHHQDSNGKGNHTDKACQDGDAAAEIRVGCGSCCIAGGANEVRVALEHALERTGANAVIKPVGCVGMCHQTPLVEVTNKGRALSLYAKVTAKDADAIIRRHVRPQGFFRRMRSRFTTVLDRLLTDETWSPIERHTLDTRDGPVCDFLGPQKRIATETCGTLNPLNLDEYIAHHGFNALRQVLVEQPNQDLVEIIKHSGLRGRGGAGFPTGEKWSKVRAAKGDLKYIICNGDEGDPGAFMDRMILESFPYRVLEGMIIASKAVGAAEGVLYIRAEYPLAVKRIREAITRCEERGLLGDNILNTGHRLKLRVVEGAGAFVCGEETALIASIEGRRGVPRLRPPYPAESGLWGKPTSINNVETYALIPWIIRHGPDAFAAIGTGKSKGTKVFALTGKIARGGLIEVPMGITIRQIVEDIGGGIANGRRFKAVQIGGPSGGCIPAELADLSVDYESLTQAGAIMGSGGMVVLDDSDCMVDIARYFLQFTQAESCGQCSFCRVGTKALLDILTRLCEGKGKPSDIDKLDELSRQVKRGSLCGLGQTAPNPVLTTLRYFRHEFEAHVQGRCPAGKCKALIKYEVQDNCIGCTKCAQDCPSGAITMLPYQKHTIDPTKCTRCDVCRSTCPIKAIKIV
ncbi:MAG: NAD(P)H-dependent oxidoreductase subunit E [Bacillota bacterium]